MAEIYRSIHNTNRATGTGTGPLHSIPNNISNSISGALGAGIGVGDLPHGILTCVPTDLIFHITQLMLREKVLRAEYAADRFERIGRNNSNPSILSSIQHTSLNYPYGYCNVHASSNIPSTNAPTVVRVNDPDSLYQSHSHHNNHVRSHGHSQGHSSGSNSNFYSGSSFPVNAVDKGEKAGSLGSGEGNSRIMANTTANPNTHNTHSAQFRIPQHVKAVTVSVSLIILDLTTSSAGERDKDTRPSLGGKASASQAAKEKIQIEKKVSQFATSMWGNNVVSVLQSQRMRGNHATSQVLDSFVIVACELPFHLVRDLGSIISRISASYSSSLVQGPSQLPSGGNTSTNSTNSTAANTAILNAFYSSPLALPFKRTLKAAVTELSHLSLPQPPPQPLTRNLGSTIPNSVTSSSPQGTALCKLRDVFLFSSTDEKFDFLSYSPIALTRVI